MAKKKRRKQKPAAHLDKKPDRNYEFLKNVLSGTISGLIVLILNLIIDWLTKRWTIGCEGSGPHPPNINHF